MTDSPSGARRAGVCREAAKQFSRLSSQLICVQALALPPSSSVTLASHWTSLSLSFLIWRMGINIVPLRSSNLCSLQAWHVVVWSKWRYCCWFRAEAQLLTPCSRTYGEGPYSRAVISTSPSGGYLRSEPVCLPCRGPGLRMCVPHLVKSAPKPRANVGLGLGG